MAGQQTTGNRVTGNPPDGQRASGGDGTVGARFRTRLMRVASGATAVLGKATGRLPNPAAAVTRRLYDLLPEPEEKTPRGFFYLAHIGLELIHRMEQRSIFVLPGGVAFFVLLGLLPATAAVTSIYGLLADPAELLALSARLSLLLPTPTATLMTETLNRTAEASRGSLGVGAAIALFFTLMSVNWGTKALSEALNIVFDRRESRNYFEYTGVTLLLTTLAVAIAGAYGWILFRITGHGTADATYWLRTAVEAVSIWALLSLLIGVLYRYAPAPDPKARQIPLFAAGSMTAAASALLLSWVMAGQFTSTSTFVRNFGPLASIATIVVWAWMVVVAILVGAEIAEIREEERRRAAVRIRRWPTLWPRT